jgi:CHASE1-domain containing sensor protein
MKRYEGMATIAEHLTKVFTEDSQNWISLAYALFGIGAIGMLMVLRRKKAA